MKVARHEVPGTWPVVTPSQRGDDMKVARHGVPGTQAVVTPSRRGRHEGSPARKAWNTSRRDIVPEGRHEGSPARSAWNTSRRDIVPEGRRGRRNQHSK
jgi:hypothetical protein